MEKIKLALICHFSYPAIRKQLDLRQGKYYQYRDFAKWNVNIIDALRLRDDIELHVVALHDGMRHATQEFVFGGVHYHFYRQDLPYPWTQIEHHLFPQSKRNYPRNRRYAKRFLSQIQPDIVNLIGAENTFFSITALEVENTPLMIHCQTVYANPDRIKNTGSVNKQRWDTELKLFHKSQYLACTGRMYYDLIKGYEPKAFVFPRKWPVSGFPSIAEIPKKYDFVFFARILCKNKGFDNAIEAMGWFVKIHPEAKFLAVGSKDSEWSIYDKRIKELGLDLNLEIHPPFPEYVDVLQYVKQSRFALLPITMDVLSGTILESMRMGLPVVTCRTSGTPSLNEKRDTVLISDIGDVEGLVQNMLRLYETPSLQDDLRNNAYLYLKEKDTENENNVDIMITQFKAVINHFRNGTPIPQELLYNTAENIDYRKQ